jgi:Holliday junction resolvase-like predicted endonuclease
MKKVTKKTEGKIINKRAKGVRHETEASKILASHGYMVEKKNWSKWQSPDFYGQFDLVAVLGDVTRWVQVKSHKTDYSTAKTKIKQFIKDNPTWTQPCEIWLHVEGTRHWKIHAYKINRDRSLTESTMDYMPKEV